MTGGKRRPSGEVWRGPERDHAPSHHGDAQRARTTENSHLTPCPSIDEAHHVARDRIVSPAMMGGTFILFDAGRPGLESPKQAEIRLAILLAGQMLQIAHFRTKTFAGLKRTIRRLHSLPFPRDMANSPGLIPLVI
jgi:hypothetical protein